MTGRLMRVQGKSMGPDFCPGDLVWVRTPQAWRPAPGDVVVAKPAVLAGRAVIKRVAGAAEGAYTLSGTHRDSCDSRSFGPVSREELVGVVRARVWPWGRRA